MFRKFLQGLELKVLPRGGEESQGFLEVKHSKSQNGFFTMSSLDLKLFGTTFFQSNEQKPRYLNLKISGWKLKGHSWSTRKSQNRSFLISSYCLIEPISTDRIKFG